MVLVHDCVFCIVVCGPGGPKETMICGVVVGTPGVVILIFHLLAASSFSEWKMWMRKEVIRVLLGDRQTYLNAGG